MNPQQASRLWLTMVLLGSGLAAPCLRAQTAETRADADYAELLESAAWSLEQGDLDTAEAEYLRAIESQPERAEAYRLLGRMYYWNDATSQGMDYLYQARQLDPAGEDTALDLVDALLDERDYYFTNGDGYSADAALQRAEEVVDEMLAARPDSTELRRRRAQVLWRVPERSGEAAPILFELIESHPDQAAMHSDLVQAVAESALFQEAFDFYAQLEGAPYWLDCWFRGQLHIRRAHYLFNRYLDDEQAIRDYSEGGRLLLESARVEPAYFDVASETVSYCRSWAGWVHLRDEDLESARGAFIDALGRLPENANAVEGLSHIGQKLNAAGDLEAAREFFRVACQWAPERSDFWNNYGLLCRDTERYDESFVAYRRALRLAPEDPRIINDCALLLQYHLDIDLDLAERWLLQARDLGERRWVDALDDATRADALMVYGDSLVNLGRLYDDQGRMERAAKAWNELRHVDPGRPELPENLDHRAAAD